MGKTRSFDAGSGQSPAARCRRGLAPHRLIAAAILAGQLVGCSALGGADVGAGPGFCSVRQVNWYMSQATNDFNSLRLSPDFATARLNTGLAGASFSLLRQELASCGCSPLTLTSLDEARLAADAAQMAQDHDQFFAARRRASLSYNRFVSLASTGSCRRLIG